MLTVETADATESTGLDCDDSTGGALPGVYVVV